MSFSKMVIWIFPLILVSMLKGSQSLKNLQVIIPPAAKIHDAVTFQCKYDLEQEDLYSVKWYKGRNEFFRFIPKEHPRMMLFPLPGVKVDLSRSSANEVVLLDLQLESTGRYVCEVVAEAPSFETKLISGYMYVVDVPEGAPIMEIHQQTTGHNNKIQANCTSPPSVPAMNVTWYINGIKVNEDERRRVNLDPTYSYSKIWKAPHMTVSHLEKEIDDNMFQDGVIRIQCVSTLFNLYKSEEVRYIEDNRGRPQSSSVIGSMKSLAVSDFNIWFLWTFLVAALVIGCLR